MEFWKNEWSLFVQDMKAFANAVSSVLLYEIDDNIEITWGSNRNMALNQAEDAR